MQTITYKNCKIMITGSDMNYKATVDIGLTKMYVVRYDFKSYEDVKKDIKHRLRKMFKLN